MHRKYLLPTLPRFGTSLFIPSIILSLAILVAPVLASATAGTATLAKTSLNFPLLLVGKTSGGQTVGLKNSGTSTLTITSILPNGDYHETNNCGSSLAPGVACVITVTFAPTATGVRTGAITVTDSAADSPQTVTLSGIGTYVQLTPITVSFPGLTVVGTASTPMQILVKNTNPAGTLSVNGITTSGDFTQTNNCNTPLVAGGGSCKLFVTFQPTGSGVRTGTITISDSDGASPHLAATVASGTFVAFLPKTLNFPPQPVNTSSTQLSSVLTNTGGSPLGLVSIVARGDFAQSNNCVSPLLAGASCTLSITFTPSASGKRSGTITVSDTDASNLQFLTLTATGQTSNSTVTIAPRAAAITNTQSLQFTSNMSVNWSVDGFPDGDATVGTISPNGVYTPPPTDGFHIVVATSINDSSQTASARVTVTDYPGVLTYHNDNARTGQNLNEIVLTTGNVNQNQFGKLFSYPVDGQVYAQPLYVANVSIPSQGTHNVVYIATEHDSVYAFDADGLSATPLWKTSFLDPANSITTVPGSLVHSESVNPEIGITSTPVIDPTTQTIYVVAYTDENGTLLYRLHALDMTTGAEQPLSPVLIMASVPGTGQGSQSGSISFNYVHQGQRPGLLLLNGVVYIAFASGHGEWEPYHGWLLAYDTQTLHQLAVFNTTPNGGAGGIWEDGDGPAADAADNIYVSTGQGSFDKNIGGKDLGDSFVKLDASLNLLDYFTPFNQALFLATDEDVAAAGLILLPDQSSPNPHLLAGGGKNGSIYLVNRDNMGGFNSLADSCLQSLVGALHHLYSTPAYWQSNIYYGGSDDYMRQYRLYNGLLSTSAIEQTPLPFGFPGATPSISAGGATNGIVWAIQTAISTGEAILRAYDAANISQELYDSNQAGSRDALDLAVKFSVPTVANGKVFVGTRSTVTVFGLLP